MTAAEDTGLLGYADVAHAYLRAGWNPLPLDPANNKATPPTGFTGYRGRAVTAADVIRWAATKGAHHVGIRMPPGVVGIDVDQYGDKHGADHLAAVETELGTLPPTWASTSRPYSASAIWLYRVPVGTRFPTRPCADVEFIQPHHRHAVVWPSIHREDRPYEWYDASGEPADRVPDTDELADLPWPWIERFAVRRPAGATADAATTEEVAAFIDEHNESTFPAALDGIRRHLDTATGSRHDTLIAHACWAMREAAAGKFTATEAVDLLDRWWRRVMDDCRRLDAVDHGLTEFGNALAWAVAQAAAEPDRVAQLRGEQAQPLTPPPNVDPTTGEIVDYGNLPDEFWQRPIHAHIRQAAHARTVSADAVFAAVLARVAAHTPPTVVLPAIVGSPAPLSIIVGLVGPSGSGKSQAARVAGELLPYSNPTVAVDLPPGSGEGLVEAFFGMVDEQGSDGKKVRVKRQVHRGALFYLDEGEAFTELGSRKGSTLLPMLRGAWSGATIGSTNASAETKRKLAAGSYSLGMVVAFQPRLAGPLLDDAAGGTPQRFAWSMATDPNIPDEPPDWPGPIDWQPSQWITSGTTLQIDPVITDEIRRARLGQARGATAAGDELDSHEHLGRLKIAGLLAVLDGRIDITGDDWELARIFTATSRAVRNLIVATVAHDNRQREAASTSRIVRRGAAIDDDQTARALDRMAKAIAKNVHKKGVATRRRATQATASRDREHASIDEAIEHAVERGYITVEGDSLRPGEACPT